MDSSKRIVRSSPPGRLWLFLLAVALAATCFLTACGSSSSSGGDSQDDDGGQNDPVPTAVQVSLDDDGTVLSTITVEGPDNSKLVLKAGTGITFVQDDATTTPTSADEVSIALVEAPAPLAGLPAGFDTLMGLRVILTVGGTEREAYFWRDLTDQADPKSLTLEDQGLQLAITPDNQDASAAARGLLFDGSSGSAIFIQAAALGFADTADTATLNQQRSLGEPVPVTSDPGPPQMRFNLTNTGTFIVSSRTLAQPGATRAGAFWATYRVPDPGCIQLPEIDTEICGPSWPYMVMIVEESTAEILGTCIFEDGDTATTGQDPSKGQFQCERSLNGDGSSTIKLSSMQANLPWIQAHLVRISDGKNMWRSYHKAEGGLHGSDGTVYSDPYQEKDFEFAGGKDVLFTSTDKGYHWMKDHSENLLQEEGYQVYSFRYRRSRTPPFGEVASMGVLTLESRRLLEDDIILKNGWKVRENRTDTRGNRGTYDFLAEYTGTVDSSYTVTILPYGTAQIWEASAEVTFDIDKTFDSSPEWGDVYTTSEGTVTTTVYPVYDPMGYCYGEPASFTNTYPIAKGDGDLSVKPTEDPAQYTGSASISSSTPVQPHSYRECCEYPGLPLTCEDKTLAVEEQEMMWWWMGNTWMSAKSDGTIEDTYSENNNGFLGNYHWEFTPRYENFPVDENWPERTL